MIRPKHLLLISIDCLRWDAGRFDSRRQYGSRS